MMRHYADFFTEAHRAIIDSVCEATGDHVVEAMLRGMSQEQQIAFVETFAAFGEQTRRKLEARVAHMTEAGQRLEESLQSEQKISAAALAALSSLGNVNSPLTAHGAVTKQRAIKLDVVKYGGTEGEKLLHWVFQVRAAADAQLIEGDTLRINFAVSHLKDRAQQWAYSLLLPDPNHFGSFENFIVQLKTTFLPPNSDFRHRSKYLACKQGKRTIREFVHELRYLAASLSDESSLPEPTRVTVFMNGLNACAARTQLFRTYPQSFEEAVTTALSEEFSHTLAGASKGVSVDMDLSHVTPDVPTSADRKCYSCGQTGHLARSCPRRQRDRPSNGARGRFPRERGFRQTPRPQGNAQSQ
jgi:hypothetical protein